MYGMYYKTKEEWLIPRQTTLLQHFVCEDNHKKQTFLHCFASGMSMSG